MAASPKKRRARAQRRALAAVISAPLDATWARIGTPYGHRSGWLRVVLDQRGELERLELRAGRDGDDAAIVIDRSNPQLHELAAVLGYMRFAVEHEPPPKPERAAIRRTYRSRT